MGISKLFYRAPVYKFFRFDLPINFDYPADLFLITKVISTFKMQFILSKMLVMGFFRDGPASSSQHFGAAGGEPAGPAAPGKYPGVLWDPWMQAKTLLSQATSQAGGC